MRESENDEADGSKETFTQPVTEADLGAPGETHAGAPEHEPTAEATPTLAGPEVDHVEGTAAEQAERERARLEHELYRATVELITVETHMVRQPADLEDLRALVGPAEERLAEARAHLAQAGDNQDVVAPRHLQERVEEADRRITAHSESPREVTPKDLTERAEWAAQQLQKWERRAEYAGWPARKEAAERANARHADDPEWRAHVVGPRPPWPDEGKIDERLVAGIAKELEHDTLLGDDRYEKFLAPYRQDAATADAAVAAWERAAETRRQQKTAELAEAKAVAERAVEAEVVRLRRAAHQDLADNVDRAQRGLDSAHSRVRDLEREMQERAERRQAAQARVDELQGEGAQITRGDLRARVHFLQERLQGVRDRHAAELSRRAETEK